MKSISMALAVTGVLIASQQAAAQSPISIATSPVGSLNFSLGNALGKVLTDKAGLQARVVPFGGGAKILPSMNDKRFDVAILSASDVYFAYIGEEDFKGKATKNISAAAVTLPFYLSWYVRKDSPYKTIADLKGKKVGVGYSANTSQRRSVLAQIASAGLTEADFDGVPVPHVVRAADDLAQGKIEAASFAVGAGKVAEVNVKVGGVRYLSLEDTPAAKQRMRKFMPLSSFKVLTPESKLVGILGPTNVQVEDYVIVVGNHVSEDVAYKLAKISFENQADLAAIARPFARYKPADIGRDRGIPFHPGAAKFLKEKSMWPPKKD